MKNIRCPERKFSKRKIARRAKEFHAWRKFRVYRGREIRGCCTTDIEIRKRDEEREGEKERARETIETGQEELNKNESTVRVLCDRISIDFVPVNAGIPIPAGGCRYYSDWPRYTNC